MANETHIIGGRIQDILERQDITEKFSKREIIVETNDKYPQIFSLQFVNDNIDKLEVAIEKGMAIGEYIEASCNVQGRKWENKSTGKVSYFSSFDVWKLDRPHATEPTQDAPPEPETIPADKDIDPDNLPF